MQILRKLAPNCPQFLAPLAPLGSKFFLAGLWHLFMSNPSHLAQKIRQNHQFWSNICMTPSVAALCIVGAKIRASDKDLPVTSLSKSVKFLASVRC